MCFTILQNEKTPFQAIKTRSSKSGKIALFPKRLVHGFGHFSIFCFKAIQARKMSFTILQNEKLLFQAIKTRTLRGQSMVLVKHWPFFLKQLQERKMCFSIFQHEKLLFQAIKTKSLKSRKIAIFPKGLAHGFGQKLAIFPHFSIR